MHKTFFTILFAALLCAGLAATGFTSDAIDAGVLYKRCASCHGEDGSTPAMGGASPPLQGQTAEELAEKLTGYQDETYGGERAKLMATQVRGLNEDEIQALAEHIAAFGREDEAGEEEGPEETAAIDAAPLYKRCASCHGEDGSTPAMGGASPPLQGQTAEELAEKLTGYQDETYGGDQAKLMATQVRGLSEDEIQALAEHIAAF